MDPKDRRPDYVAIDMPLDEVIIQIEQEDEQGQITETRLNQETPFQSYAMQPGRSMHYTESQNVVPIYDIPQRQILPQRYNVQQVMRLQYGPPRSFPMPQLYGTRHSYSMPSSQLQPGHFLSQVSTFPQHVKEYYQRLNQKFPERDKEAIFNKGHCSYLFVGILGKGSYAMVYKAIATNQINEQQDNQFAIKVTRVSFDHLYQVKVWAVQLENAIQDRLMINPHPNVLRFIERFTSSDNMGNYSVMELAQLGDLYQILQVKNQQGQNVWTAVKPQNCRHLIKGIAEGVRHLFSLGISHGDIKLENILVTYYGQPITTIDFDLMVPKLTDFNNSKIVELGEPIFNNQAMCSLYTAAPETYFTKVPYDMKIADVYSVGACLLALLLACQPFRPPGQYKNWNELAKHTIVLKKDKHFVNQLVRLFDESLKQLLIRVLEPQPQNRISIDQFLADNWFTHEFDEPPNGVQTRQQPQY